MIFEKWHQIFKKWYLGRIRKINRKSYNKGYNIAAGTLLRGEETPSSILIDITIANEGWNYFYQGSCDAVERLIDEKVIKDDRYYLKKTLYREVI
ncbi:MAG: hypothetical protein GWP10_13515 [Nitrospiraceae bacterium]|nr:hypothetical protein [Nitrospiraceae bacterium]